MGFRFRKSISLLPGVRVNLSKSGPSVSVGGKGATVNFGRKGTKTTYGLPGSGLSYSSYKKYDGEEGQDSPAPTQAPRPRRALSILPMAVIAVVFYALYQGGGFTHLLKSKIETATATLKETPAPTHAPAPQANAAFTVAPESTNACHLPFPCSLQGVIDSSDWAAVSPALATAIKGADATRVEWTGPANHGYVKRGKPLAETGCTSYMIVTHRGDETITRHIHVCAGTGGTPEIR